MSLPVNNNYFLHSGMAALLLVSIVGFGYVAAVPASAQQPTQTNYQARDNANLTAQAGLVNCGQTNSDGEIPNPCDWEDFMQLVNNLITWLIGIATAVASLLFMYAGFLYLTAGGDRSQANQAKGIFTNVAIGFGIILIAWLLVTTIVSLLTGEGWIDENSEFLPLSQDTTGYYEIM